MMKTRFVFHGALFTTLCSAVLAPFSHTRRKMREKRKKPRKRVESRAVSESAVPLQDWRLTLRRGSTGGRLLGKHLSSASGVVYLVR